MILEYIWIDGKYGLRSKYRTVPDSNQDQILNEVWNFDGSSAYLASVEDSEIVLCPVATYPNPFIRDKLSALVLCDTYNYSQFGGLTPTCTSHRSHANDIFNKMLQENPWFGIEQEYFMMKNEGTGDSHCPAFGASFKSQGQYYCGVGSQNVQHRQLVEKHLHYCLYAGLSISGANAEVAPNQWEFQIGPVEGISAGDQLYVARYILYKLSEEFNVNIVLNPKPLCNPWNGSGLHTNFSTNSTRMTNGISTIHSYIEKMSRTHDLHLSVYGDNSQRLSGMCETSSINVFSYGVGTRNTSIRIPRVVSQQSCGYLEDRRPASDADPYLVTSIIFQTSCL